RVVSPELPSWFSPRHAPAVWYGADRTQPMARGEAHRNVGVHYAQTRACDIGVGFALDDDVLWQSHAWLLDGPHVVETTYSRRLYWGVRLTGTECRDYCYSVGVICK